MTIPLPNIGGFSPLPLAVMIPFMEVQSAIMARAFGMNYEAGKRYVKAMSNEEFNGAARDNFQHFSTITNKMAHDMIANAHIKEESWDKYQQMLFDKYYELEKEKIEMTLQLIREFPEILSQSTGFGGEGQPDVPFTGDPDQPIIVGGKPSIPDVPKSQVHTITFSYKKWVVDKKEHFGKANYVLRQTTGTQSLTGDKLYHLNSIRVFRMRLASANDNPKNYTNSTYQQADRLTWQHLVDAYAQELKNKFGGIF